MRVKFIAATVLVLVAIGALVAFNRPAEAQHHYMVLEEVTTQFYNVEPGAIVPLPPAPFPVRNAGSNLVFTADLNNTVTGETVGTSHATCLIVTDGRSEFVPGPNPPFFGDVIPINPPEQVALAQCQQTLRLSHGDIILSGLLDEYAFEAFQPASYAIVGGTGLYSRARGSATITQVVFPHTSRIEINLINW